MKKFLPVFKRVSLTLLTIRLIFQGFSKTGARLWKRCIFKDLKRNKNFSFKEKIRAYKNGNRPIKDNNQNISNDSNSLTEKNYLFTYSINGIYNKWLTDRITFKNVLQPFGEYIPKYYYQFYKRDCQLLIIPVHNDISEHQNTWEDVFNLIRQLEIVSLKSCRYADNFCKTISYNKIENIYYLKNKRMTEQNIIHYIQSLNKILVISEHVEENTKFYNSDKEEKYIQLTIINDSGNNAKISEAFLYTYRKKDKDNLTLDYNYNSDNASLKTQNKVEIDDFSKNNDKKIRIVSKIDIQTGHYKCGKVYGNGKIDLYERNPFTDEQLAGTIPNWDLVKSKISEIFGFIPQIEFCAIDIIITKDAFKISKVISIPRYPIEFGFNTNTSDYLWSKYYQKKELFKEYFNRSKYGSHKIKLKIRSIFTKFVYPRGMVYYLGITWPKDVRKDFFGNKKITVKQKFWAYRHGFLSYRLQQYDIAKKNHKQFISDFEYKWLRHINNKYRVWLEDKITIKYILSQFNEYLPAYYFYISYRNGSNKIIKMQDCPEDMSATYDSIFKLVEIKGELALKRDKGSHGDGFFRLSYKDNKYYLNLHETTKQHVIEILSSREHQYLITEYIQMHTQLKKIYGGAVNTIRLIVFKMDGINPVIGNAYMRIGSKSTGVIDNMQAGGMYAQIDINTGRYFGAKIINGHNIISCEYHPDTKVKIEGNLPNWQNIKKIILKISRNLKQLEYLGFDIAITENGIKIIEINRFVDYPRIEQWSLETTEYLLYKLDIKKKKYGYDKSRGHKLKKLPKR
jgi:hypothetical protein